MSLRTLLGRSRELAHLEAAFERAVAGRGSVFFLSGEAGIGKTRLAEELAHLAQERGAPVFWGRAWEVEGAPPCWPWIQVLRACMQTRAGVSFLEGDSSAGDLPPLLAQSPAGVRSSDPVFEALRWGSAIVALLRRMSKESALVLVFDDLHASDLASLNLLHVVARELRGLRVLVVGTFREVESRFEPAMSSLLAKIAREGTAMPLGPLDRVAVTQWIGDALGTEPVPGVASAVFGVTEGNPLFVDAIAQWLAARPDGAFLGAGFALPDSIREVMRERLARVSRDVRDILEIACVFGRECALTVLQAACEKPLEDILAAVGAGVAAGVLEPRPTPSSPVRFAHVLVREALYQAIPAAACIALHARAVDALARVHATEIDAHLAELAHHAFASAPAASWLDAADFAERAGHRAMGLFAFDDAAGHYERALTALDHVRSADDARRAELLWRFGLSRIRLGDVQPGRDACERAAAIAERAGKPESYARAVLAAGSEPTPGHLDVRLTEMLESSLRSGLNDDALRTRVMARLAAALTPTRFRERPLQLARDAMAMARASGDRRLLAEVLSTARRVFSSADELEERMALDREMAVLSATLGETLLELQAHSQLAIDAIEQGDPHTIRTELRIQRQLADELRIPQHRMRAFCMNLLWATLQGDAEVIAHCEREIGVLSERLDDLMGPLTIAANRLARATVSGDAQARSAAMTELDAVAARHPSPVPFYPGSAIAGKKDRLAGSASRRDEEMRAYFLAQFPNGPDGTYGINPMLYIAPVCIRLRDRPWLEKLYELMLPYANRVNVTSMPFVSLGPIAYHLAQLAAALGHRPNAVTHFENALAICQRSGFVELEARTRRELEGLELPEQPLSRAASPRQTELRVPDLQCDGEFWTLRHEGHEVRLKDSKGLRYLAVLLREPGREFHVADLVQAESGIAIEAGDAGDWLDARAKAAYAERLALLAAAREDAEARGDAEGLSRIAEEREALGRELARAAGVGGRARRAGAASERARINIQRRIRDVLERVSENNAALARYLERHLRTGVFCSWEP